ncbi:hypothetical protein F444_17325 [Phytophthora nicotianae P1976]|uniref:Uncharacterized protein n=1 Tax=Phytophthora nicotianae P1976 TaxID=1317066 RepID=A0A080ZFE3_PHYNI|nr:hypothetical protein F444_17325 [Phytophthora nicotianae P1976]
MSERVGRGYSVVEPAEAPGNSENQAKRKKAFRTARTAYGTIDKPNTGV